MILEVVADNAPQAYSELRWNLMVSNMREEDSRIGKVMTPPHPVMLEIRRPEERVIFDPDRDANPFFHVMEWVWMLAGSNDAKWLSQFNSRMMAYADDGVLRGAYGWRWRNPTDQVADTINLLTTDPKSRQAVISMWDPVYDGARARTSDRPCNTHIYFRITSGLDMTVCNRSNDLIWGMLGSNVVHFTFLQEMIASALNIRVGRYRIFTNNLHVYEHHWPLLLMKGPPHDYYFEKPAVMPMLLLNEDESWQSLREDAETLLNGGRLFTTNWFNYVAYPMYKAYLSRTERNGWIQEIRADDWKLACEQWAARRSGDRAGGARRVQGEEVSHGGADIRGDRGGAHSRSTGPVSGVDGRTGLEESANTSSISRLGGEKDGGRPVSGQERQPRPEESTGELGGSLLGGNISPPPDDKP